MLPPHRPVGESAAGLQSLAPTRPHGLAWFLLCGTWVWLSGTTFLCPSAQGCCWDPAATSQSPI